MSKTFSIIIPAYNRSDTLRRALESLRAQTDRDFEVVVCDDGSSEDIGSVLKEYGDLDIKFQRITRSGSPARPRNTAIALATGEWISFLDSDDWWASDRVEWVKRNTKDADIIYHRLEVVYSKDAVLKLRKNYVGKSFNHPLLFSMISKGNPFATSATAVRRSMVTALGGMWEAGTCDAIDDFDLWLRLAAELSPRVKYIPKSLGYYEVSDDNISAFSQKQYVRHRRLFRRQQFILPQKYKKIAGSEFEYILGVYALKLGLRRRALYHFCAISPWVAPKHFVYAVVKYFLT